MGGVGKLFQQIFSSDITKEWNELDSFIGGEIWSDTARSCSRNVVETWLRKHKLGFIFLNERQRIHLSGRQAYELRQTPQLTEI